MLLVRDIDLSFRDLDSSRQSGFRATVEISPLHSLSCPGVFARTTVRMPFLVSLNHHSATVAGDLQFFLCGDNLNLVRSKAKELETVGG